MNTNVVLTIDTRHQRKDGLGQIILRVRHNNKNTSIKTGYLVTKKNWDKKNRRIRTSCKRYQNITRLNNFLEQQRIDAIAVLTKLDEAKQLKHLSVKQIKDKIVGDKTNSDFFSFTEQLIKDQIEEGRVGNARSYKCVLSVLKNFHRKAELPFTTINYDFLKKFEKKHLANGNTLNGLAVYMRTIKAIYNKAIKYQLVERELYPFSDYKIKTTPTRKRAISIEDIGKLEALELEPDSLLQFSKDLFFASFYMMGMNFKDIALLRVGNIIGGRLNYQRAKTAEQFNFEILPQAQVILDKYITSEKAKTDYIFSIIKRTAPLDIEKDVQEARKRHNKRLKSLAAMSGIEETLTTYVGRHSFATIARNKKIPVEAIKEMLGHSSIKTTQTYLASLPSKTLDDYNKSVFE